MNEMSRLARLFIFAVTLVALLSVLVGAFVVLHRGLSGSQLVAALVTFLLFVLASRLRADAAGQTKIDLGLVMILAAPLILGPALSIVVIGLGKALTPAPGTPLVKRVFNAAGTVLSTAAGGLAYAAGCHLLSAPVGLQAERFQLATVPAFGVAAVAVCTVNALLVANVVALTQRVPRRQVLAGVFFGQTIAYLGYGLFGLLLAVLWLPAQVGPMAAMLVLLPLVVARWVFASYTAERKAYESTVRALVRAVETKDLYTRQHGERVSKAAVMIARRGGMRQDRVEMLRYAGFLHDVGKLGVPTRVLQKNGRLSDAEFDAVALHPLHGFEITSGIEFLGEAHEGIRHHHERLDGRGYPSGLKGEEIPEFARILAVADAFDAMTSTRSYRGARPVPEALLELERCKGTQFQPEYVDLLSAAVAEEGWELADSLPPLHVVDAAASISAQGGPRCHDEPAASHDGSAA